MGIVVNTNLASVNAQRNVDHSSSQLGKSLERLSSGLRINRAGDDAAGLAIATKLSAQVRGLNQAARNVNNAISLVQTAEGALNTITNVAQRLRELAVQAASDDNTTSDRQTLQSEAAQLVAELSRTAQTSEFNGSPLLDGSYGSKFFQIGANYSQTVTFTIGDVRAKSLGSRATVQGGALTDGADNGINANAATGEAKINGTNVVTSDGDDQVSVLEIQSLDISSVTATNAGATLGTTNLGTVTNASIQFNQVIQKNDFGDYVSIAGSVLFTATTAIASVTIVASLVIGDSATTISTTGATVLQFTIFSSYASLSVTGTAAAAASVVLADSTYRQASINYTQASLSGSLLEINGTFVNFTALNVGVAGNYGSVASYFSKLVSDINTASVANVQAVLRAPSNAIARTYVLQATKGVNLALKTLSAGVASNIPISATFATNGGTTVIYNGQSSAIGKAAAVNAVRGATTVTGTANSNVVTGSSAITAVTLRSGDLVINGTDIGAFSVLANDGSGDLVAKINAQTASTGVTAAVNSESKLVLTATDGRNITIRSTTLVQTALSVGGNSNSNNVQRGSITLNSTNNITVSGTKVADLGADLTPKTYTADLTNRLSLVDLSTQDRAAQALLTIDAALDQVNDIRSGIGAIQSRLENTVVNLKIAAENFTASESRIRDADFAFETAQFTRNQILVQAGTAILAQANTTSQIALQLLQR